MKTYIGAKRLTNRFYPSAEKIFDNCNSNAKKCAVHLHTRIKCVGLTQKMCGKNVKEALANNKRTLDNQFHLRNSKDRSLGAALLLAVVPTLTQYLITI